MNYNAELLEVTKENLNEAQFMAGNFLNKSVRNRIFFNVAGAESVMSYLGKFGFNVENMNNIHSIKKVIEKLDIADIILDNIHIDVRVIFDKNVIFIPKSHFKYGIVPDIYVILEYDNDINKANFIGFVEPSAINFSNSNNDYYFVEPDKLSSPFDMIDFITDFKGNTIKTLSSAQMLRGRELSVKVADHDVTEDEFKEFVNLLIKSKELRASVTEFDNFETLASKVAVALQVKQAKASDDSIVDFDAFINSSDSSSSEDNSSNGNNSGQDNFEDINGDSLLDDGVESLDTEQGYDPVAEVAVNLSDAVEEDIFADHTSEEISDFSIDEEGEISGDSINDFIVEDSENNLELSISDNDAEIFEGTVSDVNVEATEDLYDLQIDTQKTENIEDISDSAKSTENIDFENEKNLDIESGEEFAVDENELSEINSQTGETVENSGIDSTEVANEDISNETIIPLNEINDTQDSPEVLSDDAELEFNDDDDIDFSNFDEDVSIQNSENLSNDAQLDETNISQSDEHLADFSEVAADSAEVESSDNVDMNEDNEISDFAELPKVADVAENGDESVSSDAIDFSEVSSEKSDINSVEIPEMNDDVEVSDFSDFKNVYVPNVEEQSDENDNPAELVEVSNIDVPSTEDSVENAEVSFEAFDDFENFETVTPVENNVEIDFSQDDIIEDGISRDKVRENSLKISSKNPVVGEIFIDINKDSSQPSDSSFENDHLQELYETPAYSDNGLNNGVMIGGHDKQKTSVPLMVGIGGIAFVVAVLGIILFSVSKYMSPNTPGENESAKAPDSVSQNDLGTDVPATPSVTDNQVVMKDSNRNGVSAPQGQSIENGQVPSGQIESHSIPANAYLSVRKLSWEVPDYVSYDENFKQYFQSSGKSLKAALSSDLLLATDYTYSDQVRVSIMFDRSGTFKNARILLSSGSGQVDSIVLQSVNQTLKVLKAPNSLGNDSGTTVILKIYF